MDLVGLVVVFGLGVVAGGVLMHAFGSTAKREFSILHDRVSALEQKSTAPTVHVVTVPAAGAPTSSSS